MLSKIAATALLLSNPYTFSKFNKFSRAECEQKSSAEQGASDLDKIFAGADGGMPPDPEEIQEMLMKA